MKTFMFDITAGKSKKQLKSDYVRLIHAVGDLENTVLHLADLAPTAVEQMPEPYRTRVKNMLAAYKDQE